MRAPLHFGLGGKFRDPHTKTRNCESMRLKLVVTDIGYEWPFLEEMYKCVYIGVFYSSQGGNSLPKWDRGQFNVHYQNTVILETVIWMMM